MRVALVLSLLAPLVQAAEPLALRLGEHELSAEYALTAEQRQLGLMGRRELATDSGMLFRFDEVRHNCLWMKDTPLPLSAAFLDERGVIVDLIDLEPFSREMRCAQAPARYALETNRGWFTERALGLGTPVQGIPGNAPLSGR